MRVRSLPFAVFTAVALLCIFALPLFVPMRPSISISWQFGFHNRTALLACLLSLCVCAFAVREPRVDTPAGDDGLPMRLLWQGMLATAAMCLVAFAIAYSMGGMDEAPYLITRVRLALAGQRPYQDFEFLYGPALLYLPAACVRVLGLSPFGGYSLSWFLMWMAGSAMQFYTVRAMRFPREHQRTAFWLMWAVFIPFTLNYGETYAPLRQLAVLASMLLFQKLFDEQRWGASVGAALGCVAGMYLLSPELPVAFTFAAVFYAVCSSLMGLAKPHRKQAWMCAAGMAVGAIAETVVALRMHEFDSAKEFGGGGADLPPMLAPATLALLAALGTSAIFCGGRIRSGRVQGPAVAACIAAYTLLPGAFGRSDPLHYWIYLLGAVFTSLLLASARRDVWKMAVVVFVLFAPLQLFVSKLAVNRLILLQSATMYLFPHGDMHPGGLRGKIAAHLSPQTMEKLSVRAQVGREDPAEMFTSETPVMQAPFGYHVRGVPNVLLPNVELGYFDGLNDVMAEVQIRRKVNEMASHPERDLLLPRNFNAATACNVDPGGAISLMRALYGYNYYRGRNAATMLGILCSYIGEHYRFAEAPVDPSAAVELWKRVD